MTAMKTAEARARRMKEGTDRRRGEIFSLSPPTPPFHGPLRPRPAVPLPGPALDILLYRPSFTFRTLSLSFTLFLRLLLHLFRSLSFSFSLLSIPLSFISSNLLDSTRRCVLSPLLPSSFRYALHTRNRDTIETTPSNCIDMNITERPRKKRES